MQDVGYKCTIHAQNAEYPPAGLTHHWGLAFSLLLTTQPANQPSIAGIAIGRYLHYTVFPLYWAWLFVLYVQAGACMAARILFCSPVVLGVWLSCYPVSGHPATGATRVSQSASQQRISPVRLPACQPVLQDRGHRKWPICI